MGLAPLLAVAAFAIAPAVAQAEPHWYSCHEVAAGTGKYTDPDCTNKVKGNFELTRLPFTSAKTQVISWGKLTIHNAVLGEFTCKVIDAGNVWNVALASHGLEEVEVFTLYECTSAGCKQGLEVTSEGLPWPTELIVVAGVIRVKIGTAAKPIKSRLKCAEPVVNLLFEGQLTPRWVNNSPSFAEFGEGSGELTNPEIGALTVTGKDKILGFENQEEIQVFNP
jgi:hypothetical protein